MANVGSVVSAASSDDMYFLPTTLAVHLPGLTSGNPADSPHLPVGQKANPPEVPGLTDIQPERIGTDFGMMTSFKWTSDDYNVLKEVVLVVTLAPLTAGAGGANPRYPDDVLCQAIDHVDFQVGGTTLQSLTGDEIHFKTLVEKDRDEQARLALAQNMNLPATGAGSRAALATAVQTVMLELPFWWTLIACNNWHQYAIQRQTKILVYWRGPNYILQQDTTNVQPTPNGYNTYIVNQFLRFKVSALDTATKDAYTRAVKSLGTSGIDYLLTYNQWQTNNDIPTGSQTMNIQLSNFNKPTSMLRFVARPAANLQPNFNNNQRFVLLQIAQYWAQASGHYLYPIIQNTWAQTMLNGKEFLGPVPYYVYHCLFNDYPDVVQYPMGIIEFSKLQNPTLTVDMGAPVAADVMIDVMANAYNYVRLVVTGDNRSAVALEQPL